MRIAFTRLAGDAELRLHQLLSDPRSHDPIRASRLNAKELEALADANDSAAARASLEAELRHWRSGAPIGARAWVAETLAQMAAPAAERVERLVEGAPGSQPAFAGYDSIRIENLEYLGLVGLGVGPDVFG